MTDLKKIKKDYGEEMAHFCRANFSTILEHDGLLYDILSSHFAPSKFLYDDLVNKYDEFKNYIYSFLNRDIEEVEVDKTPRELLDEAGYILYECKSEEDIQSFKKYYAKGEELCTFNGGRLDYCHVFFAVKKDVDEIKREDYKNPMRQDKYGTSVISIQFSKGVVNTLSIKNRYNHTVGYPDATFSNDLENIIAGLTKSFEKTYNLKINSNKNSFELPGYVLANDGKFYKYNYEINNIYYCPNNIIIDNGKVITEYQQNERYIVLDYFVLDLKKKKIFLLDANLYDNIIDRLNNIEKIEVTKNKETGDKEIKIKTPDGNAKIVISCESIIEEYEDNIEKDIFYNFLYLSKYIQKVSITNVKIIDSDFLKWAKYIQEVNLPNVKKIGNRFMYCASMLKEIHMPNVIDIGNDFLKNCSNLKEIYLDSVINIGNNFLAGVTELERIYMPNVKTIGDSAFEENESVTELNLPNVVKIGNKFFKYNEVLKKVSMPNVKEIGDDCMSFNDTIEEFDIPDDAITGICFLYEHPKYARDRITSSKIK